MVKKKTKLKTGAINKAYGTPLRIKDKTINAVHLLQPKAIPFNRKLWNICKALAESQGISIE
jgi:hypothetical protein